VTVTTLGQPAELAAALKRQLACHAGHAFITVIPRDEQEFRCAGWQADHYEVCVYYTVLVATTLTVLEEQLRDVPGVYATTQVHGDPLMPRRNIFSNPGWPQRLGERRRDRDEMRPQVLALIRDPEGTPS
jgi:hypothetical protein